MKAQNSNIAKSLGWIGKHRGLRRLLLAAVVCGLPAATLAESTISNGFLSKTQLPSGTVVTQTANPEVVTAANLSNINGLLGVVTSSSAISFTSEEGDVQVVSGGIASAFVSDAKGDIHKGDRITVGELSGVGVKLKGSGRVLGIAQQDFNQNAAGAKSQSLTDTKGKKHQVALGQIPVMVNVSDYAASSPQSSLVPRPVQTFVNHLLQREVSPPAIIVAEVLLVAGLAIAGSILYGAAKGGMISMGRNPLSKRGVLKIFGQAVLIALSIMLLCMGLAYMAIVIL